MRPVFFLRQNNATNAFNRVPAILVFPSLDPYVVFVYLFCFILQMHLVVFHSSRDETTGLSHDDAATTAFGPSVEQLEVSAGENGFLEGARATAVYGFGAIADGDHHPSTRHPHSTHGTVRDRGCRPPTESLHRRRPKLRGGLNPS